MLTDTQAALLAAIAADPDDPTPKLVYADWLDDMGDPEAMAWRWLVVQGKRPSVGKSCHWFHVPGYQDSYLPLTHWRPARGYSKWYNAHTTYLSAMQAAAEALTEAHLKGEIEL